MNLELCPESTSTTEFADDELRVHSTEGGILIEGNLSDQLSLVEIFDTGGRMIHRAVSPYAATNLSLTSGIYMVQITVDNRIGTFVINK